MIAHAEPINEEAHVRPQQVLFVDHAKTQPRVAAVQVHEQRVERRAFGLHVRVARVRAQRPGDQHFHRRPFANYARSATSTA